MEIIYKSKFHVIEYSEETQTMSNYWLTESRDLDEVSYKEEVLTWLELHRRKKPVYLFSDLTNFIYTISPEEQEWGSIQTSLMYEEHKCRKHAFIISPDFFSQLSIEQSIETTEKKRIELEIQYFDVKENALEWLYNKTQVRN